MNARTRRCKNHAEAVDSSALLSSRRMSVLTITRRTAPGPLGIASLASGAGFGAGDHQGNAEDWQYENRLFSLTFQNDGKRIGIESYNAAANRSTPLTNNAFADLRLAVVSGSVANGQTDSCWVVTSKGQRFSFIATWPRCWRARRHRPARSASRST